MSYKRHMVSVNNKTGKPITDTQSSSNPHIQSYQVNASASKYNSYLPETYSGHPNRIDRYFQYDDMDYDAEINAALDTLADFCTQSIDQTENPFNVLYTGDVNETEMKIINTALEEWIRLNRFRSRLWYIFRNTVKYGDQFFIRDPETFQWTWVDHVNVLSIMVNDAQGKKPEAYSIKDLDLNLQEKVATSVSDRGGMGVGYHPNVPGPNNLQAGFTTAMVGSGFAASKASGWSSNSMSGRSGYGSNLNTNYIAGDHVVHISLNVGMDANWPFGNSVLDSAFKPYKQKSLLEDAIVMNRLNNTPVRRIFSVDVGNMKGIHAMAEVERFRNEIHTRRIPSATGGGTNVADSAYNPLSPNEDYFLPVTADGRQSKVEIMPSSVEMANIDDLMFFDNQMLAAMRIPASYRISGKQENTAVYNDGKVGTALVQEYRFNKYCIRIQNLLQPIFDKEFKAYLKWQGLEVPENSYEIRFNPPQNFTDYRDIELKAARVNLFNTISTVPYIATEIKLTKYLGLTQEELEENMRLWAEENADKVESIIGTSNVGVGDNNLGGSGLEGIGIRSSDMDMGTDFEGVSQDGPVASGGGDATLAAPNEEI